jgi:GTP cyclohydrolase I
LQKFKEDHDTENLRPEVIRAEQDYLDAFNGVKRNPDGSTKEFFPVDEHRMVLLKQIIDSVVPLKLQKTS